MENPPKLYYIKKKIMDKIVRILENKWYKSGGEKRNYSHLLEYI